MFQWLWFRCHGYHGGLNENVSIGSDVWRTGSPAGGVAWVGLGGVCWRKYTGGGL